MRKYLILLLVVLLGIGEVSAQSKKKEYRYEVAPVSVGAQGTYLIKVFSYAKSKKKALNLVKENAIHAVLFSGFTGGNGIATQKPLVSNKIKSENEEFFEKFFENKEYERFVNLSTDSTVKPGDMIKVGKLYKIGFVVSVNKDGLREYLESQGILKSLGGMF
ncbi:MAG: hypothetical protein U0J38_02885 [Bacteroidales bacterium]|nr:hypothetical protein [Bacteroidales bacterium]MEE0883078.1 hypothetical protein [Bacteroidales bacterium]MEE1021315.1 hypothetical protein [Bacteroidales bacterium]MEE1119337.1 hypothetical protein [Bacteroidales bacterium]